MIRLHFNLAPFVFLPVNFGCLFRKLIKIRKIDDERHAYVVPFQIKKFKSWKNTNFVSKTCSSISFHCLTLAFVVALIK